MLHLVKALEQYVEYFETNKGVIADIWLENKNVTAILNRKGIDVATFKLLYAAGVLKYFVGILRKETAVGNCPVMQNMLEAFAAHNISSEEIFLICSGLRKSLIHFCFMKQIAFDETIAQINDILDQNFSGIIRFYDEIIDEQMRHLEYQHRKFEEYTDAIDKSANVVKTDIHGYITYVNDAFVKTTGYSRKKLIGKTHRMLRHHGTPKETYQQMWQILLGKKIWFGTLQNRAKDGHNYYINTSIVPLLDEHNEIKEFLSIQYEVTELIEATHKAQAAEQAKAQFVASMSHELRTPLNAIIGFSQILSTREDTPDAFKSYIEKIAISGQNLLQLVNNILDYSKYEAGKLNYFFQPFKLGIIMDEISILLESQSRAKKVDIVIPQTNIIVWGDKQLIKQTLINLFSNAIKFTPKDSSVKLTYECDELNQYHIFSVSDEGGGLDEMDVNGLFQPFYQGENSKENALRGTGLGLTICKHIIVDIHKGNIWARNNSDKGAVFSFSIPINTAEVGFNQN